MKFFIRDLVTFTEEILDGKLYSLCDVNVTESVVSFSHIYWKNRKWKTSYLHSAWDASYHPLTSQHNNLTNDAYFLLKIRHSFDWKNSRWVNFRPSIMWIGGSWKSSDHPLPLNAQKKVHRFIKWLQVASKSKCTLSNVVLIQRFL